MEAPTAIIFPSQLAEAVVSVYRVVSFGEGDGMKDAIQLLGARDADYVAPLPF